MNTALILAGGVDVRFKMDIPKQFVNVNNRPIIVYTLEIMQGMYVWQEGPVYMP